MNHSGPSLWPAKLRSYQSTEPLPIKIHCEASNKTTQKVRNGQ